MPYNDRRGKVLWSTDLSEANPNYYQGVYARGIGSPHTPANHVWPLGLIMQGMTSSDDREKEKIGQGSIF